MTQSITVGSGANWYGAPGSPAPKAVVQFIDASGANNTLTFDAVVKEEWDEGADITEHAVEVGSNIADHVRVKLITCSLQVYISNEPLGVASNSGQGANQPTETPTSLNVPTVTWTKHSRDLIYPIWENQILARSLFQLAAGTVGDVAGGGTGSAIGAIGGELLAGLLFQGKAVTVATPTTAGLSPVVQPGPTALVNLFADETDYVAAMHTALSTLKSSAQLFSVLGTKKVLFPMAIESLDFSRSAETGSGENITIGFKEMRIVTTQVVPAPIPNLSAGGGTPAANHGGQDPAPVVQQSAASAALAAVVGYFSPATQSAVTGAGL